MTELQVTRLPTLAGGKEFTHIPDHVRQDLDSLRRECVVYTDFWVDEIEDFRHVRIEFTSEEREDFFRRTWAYELFLRAGHPELAADVPGIDPQVASDADTYSMQLVDGTEIPAPYHCFAAFLGPDLERLVCSTTDRASVLEFQGKELILFEVRRSIESLQATIRSFNNREAGLKPWTIDCEDDVRDLLYVMLRPRIADIKKEEAIPSRAGTHKFADLCSKSVPFLIEVKWINKQGSWKRRLEEIAVDIQSYWTHPSSDNLIFVIVDSIGDIPDPGLIEKEMTTLQSIDGREMSIRTIVCET